MRKLAFLASLAALALACPASAKLISFDQLPGSDNKIPDGWAGLHWSTDFFYLDGSGTRFEPGVVSAPNVAFNRHGDTVSFGRKTPFELDSMYITAVYRNGLNIRFTGKLNGVTVPGDVATLAFNTSGPIFLNNIDWDVNEVVFYAFGGAKVGKAPPITAIPGQSTDFQSFGVPEQSTWALILLGFAGLGCAGCRGAKNGRPPLPVT